MQKFNFTDFSKSKGPGTFFPKGGRGVWTVEGGLE